MNINTKRKSNELNFYQVIIFRMMLALFLFWLSRLLFYVFNTGYFYHLDFAEVLSILFFGLRFDLSAIIMINAPFLLMMIVPIPIRRNKIWRGVADTFYFAGNIFGLMANFTDIVYFRFTQKRMTGDIFKYATDDVDLFGLMPQFIHDYWLYQIAFLIFVAILVIFVRMLKYEPRKRQLYKITNFGYQFAAFLLASAVIIIGIRGGFQLKPINIITAGKVSEAKNAALVLNTPFTIIKTMNMKALQHKSYFSKTECEAIFSPVFNTEKILSDTLPFRPKNIVIIIIESLSNEHIGAFNSQRKGYSGFTPFLDSLMQHAVVFKGFANGKQSIEGIPSILASLPNLMDRPYINSAYAGAKINSLASLLKTKGYTTAFYHGGTNGTMDFDGFADIAGFGNYYGRTEYNNDNDFDGNWGIFDEPYFQYFAQQLNKTPQPFFTTIFSLSSHHPYTIPNKHKGRFAEGNLEIQKTIEYADYSLGKFFETVSAFRWFSETIFIITADHTSEAYFNEYKTKVGMYQIPIIFYAPGMEIKSPKNKTASQADIMPSILGLIGYENPYIAFGENLFSDNNNSFAVNYLNGVYQILQQNYVLQFNGNQNLALYNFEKDPLLEKNLINELPKKTLDMQKYLKAYIQQYNNRMIENRLIISP